MLREKRDTMVQSKKFKGVRRRQWGSWVSEIRHPLLKKRVWLGTFDSPEKAAKAYDQAAVLMSGRNAKTNFPFPQASNELENELMKLNFNKERSPASTSSSTESLSQVLHAKLRKSSKPLSPSLTCLRLDTENSHIGVWQKRAGASSNNSKWVMTVKLDTNSKAPNGHEGSNKKAQKNQEEEAPPMPYSFSPSPLLGSHDSDVLIMDDDEERITSQMIEELLIK